MVRHHDDIKRHHLSFQDHLRLHKVQPMLELDHFEETPNIFLHSRLLPKKLFPIFYFKLLLFRLLFLVDFEYVFLPSNEDFPCFNTQRN